MTKSIYDVSWLDLIPSSISGDVQVQAISAAVTPQLQEVSNAIKECTILVRIDELSENVIDLLAWQYHVDFYEPDLTLTQKRALVKTSIDAHRHKGTPYAVKLVVTAILEDAEVQEWFDYGGDPYYFRVVKIGGQMIDADTYTRLKKAIDKVKNTRSWLDGVSLTRTIEGSIYFGILNSVHRKVDIHPIFFNMSDITNAQYLGAAMHIHRKTTM
ncbi:hypothetical protein SPSIL_009150 [Sporomusa silvacetica DSM 10669]|uniref:Phage tail protein n=1 Tax=Sporomusa silvacetica DSM 10669 TaxID=1123289 RepID=A0ABZ3IGJ8_9FIRM|nr:phage tail protein I [Sporomusa silvacetica]OZC13125.1 phage tail protein [Sporomusa silvacetica DSM 10669]